MNKDGDRKACIFFYAGVYRTGLFGWTVEFHARDVRDQVLSLELSCVVLGKPQASVLGWW